MKKKILLLLSMCMIFLCLVGCDHEHDTVDIYNRTDSIADNIIIEIKDGYFYDKHEKFTVDDNTIGLTIYFSKDAEEAWD